MPAQSFLEEVICLGGLPMTRATAHAWMKHDGHDARTCDHAAFAAVQKSGLEPMTLAEILEYVGDAPPKPSLEHQLRYVDLFFGCAKEAQNELVASGRVKRHYSLNHEREADAEARADARIVSDYASRLIGQRAVEEGLPFTVLTTDRVRAAYLEHRSLMSAPAAIRAPQVAA